MAFKSHFIGADEGDRKISSGGWRIYEKVPLGNRVDGVVNLLGQRFFILDSEEIVLVEDMSHYET
jgi:hypothetical protein